MNECKGWMGKVFGHKFQSKIIEYIPNEKFTIPETETTTFVKYSSETSNEIIKRRTFVATKKYKIVCTRCGAEKK